jgi:O-acetylhomoserine/O-acetylserine sulfhydrylase-like pyridoxal-dependent enzyme
MYASVAMLSTLVPAGGHIVTTTDLYRKTRIYMETELPKRGITVKHATLVMLMLFQIVLTQASLLCGNE